MKSNILKKELLAFLKSSSHKVDSKQQKALLKDVISFLVHKEEKLSLATDALKRISYLDVSSADVGLAIAESALAELELYGKSIKDL